MGDAKKRGTFEVRLKAAEEAAKIKIEERRQRLLAEEAALTPEERVSRKDARRKLSMISALAVGALSL